MKMVALPLPAKPPGAQLTEKAFMKKMLIVLISCLSFFTANAHASSEKKGEGGALYAKVGSFTVNLLNIEELLQTDISVKLARPETLDAVKAYLPFIKHDLILLLSTQDSKQLATLDGKRRLMERCKVVVNKAIKRQPETGVTDVLLESFVIQQ